MVRTYSSGQAMTATPQWEVRSMPISARRGLTTKKGESPWQETPSR